MILNLDKKRQQILTQSGHLLIEGGPGSGKTTIALLKAKQVIDDNGIRSSQKVLFLSFARSTVSRIEEKAQGLISKDHRRSIEINTYHGFCWSVIQSYAKHLIPHRRFTLIAPPNLAAAIAGVEEHERDGFRFSMLHQGGQVCFDLFAKIVTDIFNRSEKISSIYSESYPIIIVDEFQDTDQYEWELIKNLGKKSRIIALADLEQRIFEFRGASATRIPDFKTHFSPQVFDLGKDNNRSGGKDITLFGDDILSGANKQRVYNNVKIVRYNPFIPDPKSTLRFGILESIKRLKKSQTINGWSIAILTKTKSETLQLSNYLINNRISHEVIIDSLGPALAATIIAELLQPVVKMDVVFNRLLSGLINHIKGRKGEKITKTDLKLSQLLEKFLKGLSPRGAKQEQLLSEVNIVVSGRLQLSFVGVPEDDWLMVRKLFQDCTHPVLKNVFEDAKYLRLLNRGAILSQKLSSRWRESGVYENAASAVDEALVQEHFSMTNRHFKGIFLMNIHKCKGKEFDEVIIWEDSFVPFVYQNANPKTQDRILLRVGATRARNQVTIFTPQNSPCVLL